MAVKSPMLPIGGMVLVWGGYVCFSLMQSPAPAEHHGESRIRPTPNRAVPAGEPVPATVVEPPVAKEDKPQEEVPEKSAPKPEPLMQLTAEDKELLEILSAPFEEEDLDRLLAFVAEHPDHVPARAALVMHLLRRDGEDDAAIRPHVEALQTLMPDYALPDLFMARLELRAGREDVARNLLLDAAGKDMTWLPDTELFRMKFASELAAGTPPAQILSNAFSMDVPFCIVARDTLMPFLASGQPEEARAVLRFGEAMQEHGGIMIDNLVGCALVKKSIEVMQKGGALTEAEQALLNRAESIRGEATLVAQNFPEVLLGNPGLMGRFMENMVLHGELRAGRRALMDHLAAQMRPSR